MRRGGACSQRPSFPFFYDLWQCVRVRVRPRHFSLRPDKTWRLLRRLQQLKAEPGDSVTNCILMTDSLVSVFEQISENVLHTKIDYFCAKYKKSQLLTKNEKTTSPSCQFSFSSLVLDAILAFEKLQMLHVRQLRFPTAPVC